MKKFIFSFLTLALVFSTIFFITDTKEVSAYQYDFPVPASIVTSNFDLSTYGIPYPTIDFDDEYDYIDITFNRYTPSLPSGFELVSIDFYAYGVKSGLPYNEVTVDYTLDELYSYLQDNFRYVLTFKNADVKYTVTFDLAGGTRTGGGELTQSVKYGGSAIAPVFYRTGYTFVGWDNSLDNITSNTTITAKWTIQKRTVSFNLLGGTRTGGGALTQIIDYGGSVTAPIVIKTGYTFVGWDNSLTNITENIIISAQWQINYYTVTFNLAGGTRTGGGALEQSIAYGGSATAPTINRTGYTFIGWDKPLTNISENTVITAQWQINTYTVTFNLNGGVRTGGGALEQTINYGGSAMAPTVSRTGYTFVRWDKSLDNITANTTITAQWQINYYTVTFNLNGGVRTGGGALEQTIPYGGSATAPTTTRTGYTFQGWDKSLDNISADTTITALWQRLYIITFDLGLYGSSNDTLVFTVPEGSILGNVVTVPTVVSNNSYYTFLSWYPTFYPTTVVSSNLIFTADFVTPRIDTNFYNNNVSAVYFGYQSNEVTPVLPKYQLFTYDYGFSTPNLGVPNSWDFGGAFLNDSYNFINVKFELYYQNNLIKTFYYQYLNIFDFTQWQDELSFPYLTPSDIYDDYLLDITFITEPILYDVSFNYINGMKYNEDGSFKEYIYKTDTFKVLKNNTIGTSIIPQPLDYNGQYFAYFTLNGVSQSDIDIGSTVVTSNLSYDAFYVDRMFNVTFWSQFTKLGTFSYRAGTGTIQPPDFTFPVGTVLRGWSDELNGSAVNLARFFLESDIDLYAITNFNSLTPDSNFEIPYQECGTFDIPCGLGNAAIYFLNEFPLISDIVHLVVPIGTLFTLFVDYFVVFETLGVLYTLSLGILFIYFIFRLFK